MPGSLFLEYKSAVAAAKSLQSCPTLCDPIDGSPPGSATPGVLQARTLERVAISFSSTWKWKVKVKSLSHVWLLATPWTVAYQTPPSMGFSRQEYWGGLPLPSPEYKSKVVYKSWRDSNIDFSTWKANQEESRKTKMYGSFHSWSESSWGLFWCLIVLGTNFTKKKKKNRYVSKCFYGQIHELQEVEKHVLRIAKQSRGSSCCISPSEGTFIPCCLRGMKSSGR